MCSSGGGKNSDLPVFWQNYLKVLEWKDNHELAFWKSRSVALEHENAFLHDYIKNIVTKRNIPLKSIITKPVNLQSSCSKSKKRHRKRNRKRKKSQRTGDILKKVQFTKEDEVLEFEINDEMLNFFEQSIRHKLTLKKENDEKESKNDYLPSIHRIGIDRQEDMNKLYGSFAPMISGMEAAMQLSFNRIIEKKHPEFWPVAPIIG